LIGEASDTRNAIEDAHEAIENANEAAHHVEHRAIQQQAGHAVRKSEVFESNLFGYDAGAPAPLVQPQMSYDTFDETPAVGAASVASRDFSIPSQPAQYAPPVVQTVSLEEDGQMQGAPDDAPELFSNEYNYGQSAPQPHVELPPPQPEPRNELPPPQPVSLARPNVVGAHNRQSSGFDSDFAMGGSAAALPPTSTEAMSPAARTYSESSAYGYDDDEEFKDVEELKKKAEMARETAGDAEAGHRKLVNEADELRQDADKANATARSLKAAAAEKKKGTFGGGKRKKLLVSLGFLVC
jgi:hypothetical protein